MGSRPPRFQFQMMSLSDNSMNFVRLTFGIRVECGTFVFFSINIWLCVMSLSAHTHIHIWTHAYIHMYAHSYTHTRIHTHRCTQNADTQVFTKVHIYMHTNMHTQMHKTCMHTSTHTQDTHIEAHTHTKTGRRAKHSISVFWQRLCQSFWTRLEELSPVNMYEYVWVLMSVFVSYTERGKERE